MLDLKRIKVIASNTREWAEKYAAENYNENSGRHFQQDLNGMCAIASAELYKRLTRAKIPAVICENKKHCFVMCRGYVVDVTATQFSNQLSGSIKVFVRKHSQVKHHFFYKINASHTSIRSLLLSQQEHNWPAVQWVSV